MSRRRPRNGGETSTAVTTAPSSPLRRRTPASAATAALLMLSCLACSSGPSGTPEATSAPPPASTSAPVIPNAASTPTTTPLTGGPVLAVKIDNTSAARPRIGVDRADVVYVEPVEGGLTRLLAVFSSSMPPQVGPVRSARESDVELLANYGRVAFAFSGGSAFTLTRVSSGPQVNVSYDASRQGFRRAPGRRAPYNLIGDPAALLARAGGSRPPADIGLRFGPSLEGGAPATSLQTAYQRSTVAFTWDAGRRQYVLTTDGKPDVVAGGGQVGAGTVVVQRVPIRASANRNVNGIATPLASVVGQGAVTVLRDGIQWSGQWSRPTAQAPTSLTMPDGRPIPLAAPPVWVLLVAEGQQVTVR